MGRRDERRDRDASSDHGGKRRTKENTRKRRREEEQSDESTHPQDRRDRDRERRDGRDGHGGRDTGDRGKRKEKDKSPPERNREKASAKEKEAKSKVTTKKPPPEEASSKKQESSSKKQESSSKKQEASSKTQEASKEAAKPPAKRKAASLEDASQKKAADEKAGKEAKGEKKAGKSKKGEDTVPKAADDKTKGNGRGGEDPPPLPRDDGSEPQAPASAPVATPKKAAPAARAASDLGSAGGGSASASGSRPRAGSGSASPSRSRSRDRPNRASRKASSGFGFGAPAGVLPPPAPDGTGSAIQLAEKVRGLLDSQDVLAQAKMKMKQVLESSNKDTKPTAKVPKEEGKESVLKLPPRLQEGLMHPDNVPRLREATGLAEISVNKEGQVVLRADSPKGLAKALSQLRRIAFHCQWGCSQAKVAALLAPKPARPSNAMLVRLAATSSRLRSHEARLSQQAPKLRIGSQANECQFVMEGIPGVSRKHCSITFEPEKGCCYIQDMSTNGTYLNGKKLPRPPYKNHSDARVRLFHGDELFFRLRSEDAEELGFVVNLMELS